MSKPLTLMDYLSSTEIPASPEHSSGQWSSENELSLKRQKQKFNHMEISINTLVLFGSVIFTGLSAGLFYGWSVSVLPGTLKVTDMVYLQTMQSINRAILNPAFFAVFFGSLALLGTSSVLQFDRNDMGFWLMLLAAACYLVGTIGLTGFGNVPLNNQLDALVITDLSNTELADFRQHYEVKWNRLQHARMICSILAFGLALASGFSYFKNSII